MSVDPRLCYLNTLNGGSSLLGPSCVVRLLPRRAASKQRRGNRSSGFQAVPLPCGGSQGWLSIGRNRSAGSCLVFVLRLCTALPFAGLLLAPPHALQPFIVLAMDLQLPQ